jgi:hypothetical protein
MKSDTWRYTVYLHPGDAEQSVCIRELEEILERIKTGELRKGTLTQTIAKALYEHFSGTAEAAPSIVSSSKGLSAAFEAEATGKQESSGAKRIWEETVPEAVEPSDDKDSVTQSLRNFMM